MSDSDRIKLSPQDLMPSWVTNLEKTLGQGPPQPSAEREGDSRGDRRGGQNRDDRDHRGGGGNRRDDRGGGGGGGFGRRDDRGGGRRDDRGGPRGQGGGRGNRGRDDDRGPRRPPEEPLPAGITAALEPSPAAGAALAQHIRSTGRTYAVSDLARMVLGSRDRYQIRFRTDSPENKTLQFCPADQSLWLSREDAAAHLLRSPVLNRYYDIREVSVDPPKGNFAVVAVCGFSGTILGPPNHHEYSLNIARLHRERFGDMSLDRYKSRIEMRRDEETIEKWKTELSTQRQYVVRPEPLTADPVPEAEAKTVSEPEPESVSEEVTEMPETGNEEVETTEIADTEIVAEEATPESEPEPENELAAETEAEPDTAADENNETDNDGESVTEEEVVAPAASPPAEILTSSEALERHFRKNFADHAIKTVAEAVLPGNVGGRLLSPPLLNLLKSESDRSRKGFPLTMIQLLCREFENAGLKFFKRGKKALHVSVARPRAIPNEDDLSERIQEIIRIVREKPKTRVVDLLDLLVADYVKPPKGETFEQHHLTEKERAVLADLRWLTMEGFIIEFPNTELMLGRTEPAPDQPAKPKKKRTRPPRKRKEKPEGAQTAEGTAAAPTDSPSDPEKIEDTPPITTTTEPLPTEPSPIAEESLSAVSEAPTEPEPVPAPVDAVKNEEKPIVQEITPEIQPETEGTPDESAPPAN